MSNRTTTPDFLLIDLFCGAGGTTTGAEMSGVCKVIAAINHDPVAIQSHAANHSDVLHMEEDILLADTAPLVACVGKWRAIYPKARLILWASLECTNFSNAKGGLPRDADSRALANGMFRYLEALQPDYFWIENVREFMSWGELDANGKPVSKLEGRDYIRWIKRVQSYGYTHDWRMLCAADFGGVTIRTRYFGAFHRPGLPFAWPQPTHAKKAATGAMFEDNLKPWRPVAEVLDFSDMGKSIFDRRKPLVDKTLRRILAGLKKFHADPCVMTCNTPGYCTSVAQPVGAITTTGHKAIITPVPFLMEYYGAGKSRSVKHPAGTVTTHDRFAVVRPWIDNRYGAGRGASIQQPAGSVTVVPKMALMSAWICNRQSIQESQRSIEQPCITVCTDPTIYLCSAFILNPQYNNKGNSINAPAPTVVASQKSRPLSLVQMDFNIKEPKWTPVEGDSATMLELKQFMRDNGIADVFMRMLKVGELKKIQGFPESYRLCGTIEDQKKFIGNSVETGVVCAWLRANATVNH